MKYFQSLKKQLFQSPEPEQLTEVLPRVFVLPFPSEDRRQSIRESLSRLGPDYKIWNVSEYAYPAELFDFNVADYSRPGYPCPPLQDLLIIVREMAQWLDARPGNQLLVHCQQNLGRTTLVLSCLLAHLRVSRDILTAESRVSALLHSVLLGNQRLYLKYFESCQSGVRLNKSPVRLRRVALSHRPLVRLAKEHAERPDVAPAAFRPYLQLFLGRQIVFNSLLKLA